MKLGGHGPNRHKRSPSSDHEKINFYGRIAIFMKLLTAQIDAEAVPELRS